jgi:caffeoyl-CoA O-methyltransferase
VRSRGPKTALVLDERVRGVHARLEREDAEERDAALPSRARSRAVPPTTGRFLFSLVAPQWGCEVLEIGGSRGYSTTWLAAGARILGGRVTSLELDPAKCKAWRRNIADAGLDEWAELVEGDAHETLESIEDVFDVVFLDADKEDYETLFRLAREKLETGGLIVADNVLSHAGTLAAYSAARQSDPTLSSVHVPLDNGLELSVVLRERGWGAG